MMQNQDVLKIIDGLSNKLLDTEFGDYHEEGDLVAEVGELVKDFIGVGVGGIRRRLDSGQGQRQDHLGLGLRSRLLARHSCGGERSTYRGHHGEAGEEGR